MSCVLQIGAGGVGGVVAHKLAMNRDVFSRIILASRTLEKCKAIADSIRSKNLGEIEIAQVDADNVESLVKIITKYKPKLVINVALPYQDLSIMEACLRTKTHYLDTANYEHPNSAHFEYKEQWAYDSAYKQAGIFALLGSGFDPGVTNVFCAYAKKHYFDEIHTIDILDCNAGDHGYAFATNFNPEINLREVSSKARYWVSNDILSISNPSKSSDQSIESAKSSDKVDYHESLCDSHNGEFGTDSSYSIKSTKEALANNIQSNLAINKDLQEDKIYRKFEREEKHFKLESNTQDLKDEPYLNGLWKDVAPLALMKEWDYREVGVKNSYLLYHEELESLIRNINGLRKIRFFMTFGESYLTHMKCLENVGLLRVDKIKHNGQTIVPIEVLKTLLPDPASLSSRTKGQTHIGCYINGLKNGVKRTIYIYNICNHEDCYKEVNAQGVSYTTGVPAMIGAKLICEGKWGVNSPLGESNSSLTQSLRELEKPSIDRRQLSQSAFSTQPTNLTQDTRIANDDLSASRRIDERSEVPNARIFVESQSDSSDSAESNAHSQSYTKERLALNANMPKGGEEQGIDSSNGAGVWNMEQNDPDFFMQELNIQGLPYVVLEIASNGETKVLEDGRKK